MALSQPARRRAERSLIAEARSTSLNLVSQQSSYENITNAFRFDDAGGLAWVRDAPKAFRPLATAACLLTPTSTLVLRLHH